MLSEKSVLIATILVAISNIAMAQDSNEGKKLVDVTFQLATAPTGIDADFYVAQALGYYEEEGLNVKILPGRNYLDTLNLVAAGQVDLGKTQGVGVIVNADKDQPVVSVGAQYFRSGRGVLTSQEITSIDQLVNKEILVSSSSSQATLEGLLKLNDIDPATNIYTLVPQVLTMITSFSVGRGDAMVTILPSVRGLGGRGRPTNSLAFDEYGAVEPGYVFIASPETVENRPEVVRSFLRATYRAAELVDNNPKKAIEILLEAMPTLSAETSGYLLEDFADYRCSKSQNSGQPLGSQVAEDWDAAVRFYQSFGGAGSEIEVEKLFTNQFFEGPDSVAHQTCN